MAFVGTDTCERGHIIPARMMVRRYERAKYACSEGHAVHTAKMPPSFIDKGKYDISVYAHLAVAKYGDQQPLNRLEGIYKRNGFTLPKSTMSSPNRSCNRCERNFEAQRSCMRMKRRQPFR
ncbi:MAG: transposase [Planctomycetota bacterium]|jgi:transposase